MSGRRSATVRDNSDEPDDALQPAWTTPPGSGYDDTASGYDDTASGYEDTASDFDDPAIPYPDDWSDETASTTPPESGPDGPAITSPDDWFEDSQLPAVNLPEVLSAMGSGGADETGDVPPGADEAEAVDLDERTDAREGGDAPVRSLAAMTDEELVEIARVLFARVFSEGWQTREVADRPSIEEQYDDLRRQLDEERRVDAFRYTLQNGGRVVIVTPAHGDQETLGEYVLRVLVAEAVWKAVDVLIGVPVSVVLNPPTGLLEAILYAPNFSAA
jgi:hypothetical protein